MILLGFGGEVPVMCTMVCMVVGAINKSVLEVKAGGKQDRALRGGNTYCISSWRGA